MSCGSGAKSVVLGVRGIRGQRWKGSGVVWEWVVSKWWWGRLGEQLEAIE